MLKSGDSDNDRLQVVLREVDSFLISGEAAERVRTLSALLSLRKRDGAAKKRNK